MKLQLILAVLYSIMNSVITLTTIKTMNGDVRGFMKAYPQGNVHQFLGIPFAAPPIGNLRFEKPRPHQGWNDTYNATTFGPSCMQYLLTNDEWLIPNKRISEDCLQLNIFVPNSDNESNPKAVMVWIHGGGFHAGQASLFDASYLALTGNVIVVTINYRLGLFGFLSTEDKVALGNYGLWDQHMAIKWVKNNIVRFGGDSASICIFGESAGGYSVGLHTVSAVNKGLFQRAISESGTVLSPRALSQGAKDVAIKTGTLLNCTTNTSQELITCLKQLTAQDILKIQSKAIKSSDQLSFTNRLGPVVDGEFISQNPVNILKSKNSPAYQMFKSVDIMAGTNNAEGGLMYFSLMGFQDEYSFNISRVIPVKVLCDVVAPAISRDYYNGSDVISKAICSNYTSAGSANDQSRSILDIYAHKQFVMPTIATNMAHASTKDKATYHYMFSHQPSFTWIQDRPQWLKGANHAGELPFVFGLYAMYKKESAKPQKELTLSRQMMIYWTNFAKTGNPNKPIVDGPSWTAFDTVNRRYLELMSPPKQGQKLMNDKFKFWLETVPALISERTPSMITTVQATRTSTVPTQTTKAQSSATEPNSGLVTSAHFSVTIYIITFIVITLL